MTIEEEVYLLALRAEDPTRTNLEYIHLLAATYGRTVSSSFISNWFRKRFQFVGSFKAPNIICSTFLTFRFICYLSYFTIGIFLILPVGEKTAIVVRIGGRHGCALSHFFISSQSRPEKVMGNNFASGGHSTFPYITLLENSAPKDIEKGIFLGVSVVHLCRKSFGEI